MTDEELSELAEALQDACEEQRSLGHRIGSAGFCMCPFGALLYPACRNIRPWPYEVAGFLPLAHSVIEGFTRGFDASDLVGGDERARELGRLFREQYVN